MDHYIVSARKYRPSTFSSVVGQKALTSTLKNAIATGRLAHAYLFCGSRGVGKTSCARIFAKTINCQHPTAEGDPCNECDSCRSFNENRSLNIIELDAASNNSVDDMRTMIEQVMVPPVDGRYRVFIIDEVHMLSAAAFNAFLKTLEEPPSYVVFILATTEKHKIIPTILSRCQIYDFNRITVADMVDHLEYVARNEGIEAERSALRVIATQADGAMRDALSIFDQVAASSRGKITYQSTIDNLNMLDTAIYSRLVDAFLAGDVPSALLIYKEVRDRGFDSHFFINGLAGHLRDLMVALEPTTRVLLDYEPEMIKQLADQAGRCTPEFFYSAMSLCNSADLNYRQATNKTFLTELLLIKLCQLLSPSPNCSGDGEGRLKPIAAAPTVETPKVAVDAAPAQPAPTVAQPASAPAEPAPTVAPTPTAPRQPRAGGRPGIHGPKLSIHGSTQSDTPSTPTMASTSPSRVQPFTAQDLQRAWDSYAQQHPTEHVLINTMRSCRPALASGETGYTVTVVNDIQQQMLHEAMPSILSHCRNTVANDSLTIAIAVDRNTDSPIAWNDRQVYTHLLETHPALRKLADQFNLTLA